MWLDGGEYELGPLLPETVIEALELCGHRCDRGPAGLVLVYTKDETQFYPIFPDAGDAESFPPETLEYLFKRAKVHVLDFMRRLLELTDPVKKSGS